MYNVASTNQPRGNNSIKVDIIENIATINSWTSKFDGTENFKELNLVSWNDRPPQYDIRNWYIDKNDGTKKAGKGVSLNEKEAIDLMHALQSKLGNK